MKASFSVFTSMTRAVGVKAEKLPRRRAPHAVASSVTPAEGGPVCSSHVTVFTLTFRALIHFTLGFVHGLGRRPPPFSGL